LTYKSSKSDFSAGNEFDSLQLPEPRHATLYQPLPPSFSPVVAVSSTSLHSITIITIPPYQFGKDRYCLPFDNEGGQCHCLFVLVAQCKFHVDPEQESEYEPHYQSTNPPTTFTCTATVTRLQTHLPVNFAHIGLTCTSSGGISTDIVAAKALHILLQNDPKNIIKYNSLTNYPKQTQI